MSKLAYCKQNKEECFAYEKAGKGRGFCKCLRDTNFTYPCPFFKTYEQAYSRQRGGQ